MSGSLESTNLPPDFGGIARLFPLPNLVLFPHVVQPLHIFEPRYCEMLDDALASDGLIAMVLLQPGWEGDYEGRPAIASVACLGRILSHQRLAGGKHNILLRGLRRAAIRRERPAVRAFRQADVELLDDSYPARAASERPTRKQQLVNLARALLPEGTDGDTASQLSELDALLSGDVSLGMLTDIFSYTLNLPLSDKQRLLAECNVDRRAAVLMEKLRSRVWHEQPFQSIDASVRLPPFSLN